MASGILVGSTINWWFGNDVESVVHQFRESYGDATKLLMAGDGCLGEFYKTYVEDQDYYFALPVIPQFFYPLLESLQHTFTNIHYEVVDTVLYHWDKQYEAGQGRYEHAYPIVFDYDDRCPNPKQEFIIPLIKVVTHDYSKNADQYVKLLATMLIRITGFSERFIAPPALVGMICDDILAEVITYSNRGNANGLSTHSLYIYTLRKEDVLLLDNTTLVNMAFETFVTNNTTTPWQTMLWNALKDVAKNGVREAPLVERYLVQVDYGRNSEQLWFNIGTYPTYKRAYRSFKYRVFNKPVGLPVRIFDYLTGDVLTNG